MQVVPSPSQPLIVLLVDCEAQIGIDDNKRPLSSASGASETGKPPCSCSELHCIEVHCIVGDLQ